MSGAPDGPPLRWRPESLLLLSAAVVLFAWLAVLFASLVGWLAWLAVPLVVTLSSYLPEIYRTDVALLAQRRCII